VSALPPLPAELTIYAASELRTRWLAAIDAEPDEIECAIDASAVAEVDAAGIQLLRSLSRALAARERTLRLERPSARLADACATLGLGRLLGSVDRPGETGA
jgi:anti-anti-sigma regulatory factor